MLSGPQSLKACPKSADHMFYGDTEEDVRAMARTWLRTGGGHFVSDVTKAHGD